MLQYMYSWLTASMQVSHPPSVYDSTPTNYSSFGASVIKLLFYSWGELSYYCGPAEVVLWITTLHES